MNIETIIQGNTDALIGLTEAVIKLTRAMSEGVPKQDEPIKVANQLTKVAVDEPIKVKKVDYPTVKALIGTLALNHREEIKQLNQKYSLAVFADLLVDKNDISKGVTDSDKLHQYHEDLLKIPDGKALLM